MIVLTLSCSQSAPESWSDSECSGESDGEITSPRTNANGRPSACPQGARVSENGYQHRPPIRCSFNDTRWSHTRSSTQMNRTRTKRRATYCYVRVHTRKALFCRTLFTVLPSKWIPGWSAETNPPLPSMLLWNRVYITAS